MEGLGVIANRAVLHAGCGGAPLPAWFADCRETRLDIDPACRSDVVASLDALGPIGPFGAVYCAHALEHLDALAARRALAEFRRVLERGGVAIIVVPDLEGVEPTAEVLFEAPSGPITGHDMIYGHRELAAANPHMRHRSGWLKRTLEAALIEAGFTAAAVRRGGGYNLIGIGVA